MEKCYNDEMGAGTGKNKRMQGVWDTWSYYPARWVAFVEHFNNGDVLGDHYLGTSEEVLEKLLHDLVRDTSYVIGLRFGAKPEDYAFEVQDEAGHLEVFLLKKGDSESKAQVYVESGFSNTILNWTYTYEGL